MKTTERTARILADLEVEEAELEKELAAVRAAHLALAGGLATPAATTPTNGSQSPRQPNSAGASQRILDALKASPGITHAYLTEKVYGKMTAQFYKRVSVLLSTLKKNGRVRNVERGRWEVVS